jgi:site-specific DNA recombinase
MSTKGQVRHSNGEGRKTLGLRSGSKFSILTDGKRLLHAPAIPRAGRESFQGWPSEAMKTALKQGEEGGQEMKYFIYARKSTDDEERQILSIQAQLDELRMLATKEGLQVVREYIEAQTAKEPGRPVFNEMLAAMERGEAQGILAWHPDRLGAQLGRWRADRLRPRHGQGIRLEVSHLLVREHAPRQVHAEHRLRAVEILCGQPFREHPARTPQETARGHLSEHAAAGIPQRQANAGHRDRRGAGLVHPQDVRGLRDGAYTYASLAKTVTGWGFLGVRNNPGGEQGARDILTNPFYIGLFRFSGEIYEGKHPPLISRELFERVQKGLKRNGPGPLCEA